MWLEFVVLCLCGVSNSLDSGPEPVGGAKLRQGYCAAERCDEQPNFVFLLTDDQDLMLGGLEGMRYTIPMMQQYGISLQNFFVNTPICCPSRATILTGRYAHNWHVKSPNACMYMDVGGAEFDQSTVGVYMQELGYTTGAFGKLVNYELGTPYCEEETAKPISGWDSAYTLCTEFEFYNLTWNVNGTIKHTGDKPKEYMTSLIGNETMKFLQDNLEAGRPFFAYIGPHAPHLPSTPADWYTDEFNDLKAPRTPNYDAEGSTHHYLVRTQKPLTDEVKEEVDLIARDRARSILSVDDIMQSVVEMLTEYNQLDNTYIIWTSDHGYHLGQFRIPLEKMQPYDTNIRVPFFIRGPGIRPQIEHTFVASMVDMTPTLLELAGGKVHKTMDGHSFADELLSESPVSNFREKVLVEYWSIYGMLGNTEYYSGSDHIFDMPNNTFIGVRLLNSTHNFLYVEFYPKGQYEDEFKYPGEYELFDLSNDKWQMWNLYGTLEAHQDGPLKAIIAELRDFLREQVKCQGQRECM